MALSMYTKSYFQTVFVISTTCLPCAEDKYKKIFCFNQEFPSISHIKTEH